ncbi:hypothetical protein JW752_05585 [Candidatus Peregrinibacteria bacterium]|nr:hypothetical protein [Candidatus Peregrinibacteria bacterium]
MKNTPKKPQGFIAIVSLLIVATIAMFFAIGMLLDGVNNASLSLSSIYYESARVNANTCLEDALIRIRQEEKFQRNLNYSILDNESCQTAIEWFAPQQIAPGIVERLANLTVTGVSHGFTRTFEYDLKIARHDVHYDDGSFEYYNVIDIVDMDELAS